MEATTLENMQVEEIFRDNILLDLFDRGFHFDFENEKHKQIVKSLKSYNKMYELFDKINNVHDIVFIIINTEESLFPLLTYLININVDKVKQILKHPYINKKQVNFIIDTFSLEQLESDFEILEIGISKGYQFNGHTIQLLEKNKDLLIKKLNSLNDNIQELLSFVNQLSDEVLSDNLIVNLIITKGYYFTKDTPQVLKSNKDALKKILGNFYFNGNSELAQQTINNCNPDILDEEILTIAKEKLGYNITIYSPVEIITECYKEKFDNYLKQVSKSYREKLKKLGDKLGSGLIYYERNNSLFEEKVLDTFGIPAIIKIYKYCNLVGNNINFNELIKNNQLEGFKYLFMLLSEQYDNFKNFDITSFINYLKKYETYGRLCLDFISHDGLTEENKKILRTLLNHKYRGLEINDVSDLKNITNIIQKHNKQVIESNSKLEIKNLICLLLSNMTLKEFDEMSYSLNADNLTKLINQINDSKIKLTLEKYIILINFLNSIRNCNELNTLKEISIKLNNCDYWSLEDFRTNFYGLFDNVKAFYGIEASSKLTSINTQKTTKEYTSSDGRNVKYIDIYDDCILFQRVLNAYGRNRKLSDFKKPHLIGKSIVSFSLISNNQPGIEREAIDIDHVTLLFDNISSANLITMDYKDNSSFGELNDLSIIHTNYVHFDTVLNMLEHTKNTGYNEYNFYVENSDGSYLYPSAVKVVGEEPTQAEIDAASYLGIPLVKIHKKEKISVNNQIQQANYSELQLDELKQLKSFFNNLDFEYPKTFSKRIDK